MTDKQLLLNQSNPKPPLPLIPLAGNHISFPLEPDPADQYLVTWAQNRSFQSASYYRIRGWFGRWDSIKEALIPFGETQVFIAAEYLEPRYKGPVTHDKHMLDIDATHRVDGWIVIHLDDRFDYGQDKPDNPTRRFIVFHPPIAKEPPRVIHQHRFGQNLIVNTTDQIVKFGLASSDARANIIAQILKNATDLGKALKGDALKQFSTGEGPDDVKLRNDQILNYMKMTDFNSTRRDAFEVEEVVEGLTWDEVQETREMLDSLFDDDATDGKQKGQSPTPKKSFFGGLFGSNKATPSTTTKNNPTPAINNPNKGQTKYEQLPGDSKATQDFAPRNVTLGQGNRTDNVNSGRQQLGNSTNTTTSNQKH